MMTAEAAAERAGGDAAGSETGEEVALRREQQMVKRARVNAALREKANNPRPEANAGCPRAKIW